MSVKQYPTPAVARMERKRRAAIELRLVADRVQLTWLERMPRRWPARIVGPV